MLRRGGISLYDVDTEKLLAVLEEKGFTLTPFTREIGIHAVSFNYYLRKPEHFPIAVIEKIEQVLGLSKTEVNNIFFADTLAKFVINDCANCKTNISHKISTK